MATYTSVVRARCQPELKARLRALADATSQRPSEVLRDAVTDYLRRRGHWPYPANGTGRAHTQRPEAQAA